MPLTSTLFVHPDEKAYALVEVDLQSPTYKGFHRYQLIIVNREDRMAEFRRDLGLAENFNARQFRVPSLWLHTVGELQDIADDLRDTTSPPSEHLPVPGGGDMLQRMLDLDSAVKAHKKGKRSY